MLRQLVYISSATSPFSDAELERLLGAARSNNARNGISGVLLYDDQSFLQILEGVRDDVDRVLTRIGRDRRHAGLTVVQDEAIAERDFSGWDMAYRYVPANDTAVAISPRRLDRTFIRKLASQVSQPAAQVFVDQFGRAMR
jgi:Sensors of blue-light using FAD